MSRSRLLARLKRIERQSRAPELPSRRPHSPPIEIKRLTSHFARQVEASGAHFIDARGTGELQSALRKVLSRCPANQICWNGEQVFRRHSIPFRLRDPSAFKQGHLVYTTHLRGAVEFPLVLHSKPRSRPRLAEIELGVGSADFAIAETGTVVEQLAPGRGRLDSIVPPAYIWLVNHQRLLPSVDEFFRQRSVGPDQVSLTTLITGPSRTTDIETRLVIGVHGPGESFVLLTD